MLIFPAEQNEIYLKVYLCYVVKKQQKTFNFTLCCSVLNHKINN